MTEALHALEFWLSSSPSHYLKILDGLAHPRYPGNWSIKLTISKLVCRGHCRFVNPTVGNSVVNWQCMVDIYKNSMNERNNSYYKYLTLSISLTFTSTQKLILNMVDGSSVLLCKHQQMKAPVLLKFCPQTHHYISVTGSFHVNWTSAIHHTISATPVGGIA